MKQASFFIICILLSTNVRGQEIPDEYFELVRKADSFYRAKDFKNSALTYSEAFKINNWQGSIDDQYNAACSWALADYPDSAFYYLERLAHQPKYTQYEHILRDTDLKTLHADSSRWIPFVEMVKQNKTSAEARLNKPLAAQLDSILKNDQKYRQELGEIEAKYGRNSPEVRAQWEKINEKDSLNLLQVRHILDTYGWLGSDIVGGRGRTALFMVIQHADLTTQLKYLPMIKEAVKKGDASPSSVALLEDRVALDQGKRQIYGSQIRLDPETDTCYVRPLEDPANVDKRRARVGLQPLAEYVVRWNIKWDAEQYQKDLPALEAREKELKR